MTYADSMTSGRQLFHRLSPSDDADLRPLGTRPHLLVGTAALVCVTIVCILAFAGAGSAAVVDGHYAHGNGTDSSAPAVVNGTRVDDTAVAITIADNHDVDEATIEASDFLLSAGSVENISVAESGSNATVTLLLDRKLNREELTVVLASDATILDTNGNELNASAVESVAVVENMDSIAPSLTEFSATNATAAPATIRLGAREELGDFNILVNGPTRDRLNISEFEEVGNSLVWEAAYSPSKDGSYRLYLQNYSDTSGNGRESGRSIPLFADLTPPRAVASVDLANSQNLSIAFDARQSSDASGIDQYRWTFGDGETATGPRVTHDYLPGNYTVQLNVTDIYGNTETDSIALNLTRGSGNASDISDSELRERAGNELSVAVQRPGDGRTEDALVSVDNARRNDSVTVGTLANGTALAAHGPVSLDGMALTLATNRSFDLGLSLAGNGSVADAAAPGRVPLAGFTVVNTLSDDEIANASIAFRVAQSRLQEVGIGAANISVLRYHDGSWNAVPTRALNASNGSQSFRAYPPGFSRFAIAATVPTTPEFAVTGASLDTDQVEPGETFTVTATVENSGAGSGTFRGALEADGTVVATSTTTVGAGETGTLSLQSTTTDTGSYDLSVNGTAAGTLTVENSSDTSTGESNGTTGNDSEPKQFVVTNASLGSNSVDVDEPFAVNATIENRGDDRGVYTAALAVNGTVVTTKTRPIPAGDSIRIRLNYLINRSGEFPISVNGTSAGTLTVGGSDDSDGGLLAPLFGILDMLPMGLLRPLALFVVAPLAVIYGVLKGLAIYLGY